MTNKHSTQGYIGSNHTPAFPNFPYGKHRIFMHASHCSSNDFMTKLFCVMLAPPLTDPIFHFSHMQMCHCCTDLSDGTALCSKVPMLSVAFVKSCPNFLNAKDISHFYRLHPSIITIVDTMYTGRAANKPIFFGV